MMNCQQATQLLSEAQDRNLSLTERASLKMHTMMCSGCHNFSRQMQTLREFAHVYARGGDGDDGNEKNEPEAGPGNETK